ncbi:EcsC family protein [Serinicoccus chungangensis]|uniref:EcsC family protein n=1 Tax=Serinicoccus chungangensis TaxID=767452 RepID=UPI00111A1460|nr:EcsC family protein [Serinicoccus chungangensis]
MHSAPAQGPGMSSYEQQAWADLQEHWRKKAERRALPPAVRQATGAASHKIGDTASSARNFVSSKTPTALKNAGDAAVDLTLEPTVKAVVGLLDWVTETVQQFSEPESVLAFHRDKGRPVSTLTDLQALDLEALDSFTKGSVWKWRSTGLVEGGAIGALTFIPVGGSIAAIGLDLVVMHALTTAVATQAAYAYGIDPTTDAGQEHVNRMLRKAWAAQAPKAGTVKSAKNAFVMGRGRVNWSQRFRSDHRIAAAVEKLLKQVNPGQHVPIQKVVTKMPYVGAVTSAGVNSTVLASMAKNSIHYSRTMYLARKHGLALPASLT